MPFAIATFLALALSFLLSKSTGVPSDILVHLLRYQLAEALQNSLLVLFWALFFSLILAGLLGWIIGEYNFWGRSFFKWALLLPLAIPSYVTAFIWIANFDFGGHLSLPIKIRNPIGLGWLFALSLFPYLFYQTVKGFRSMSCGLEDVSKTLGISGLSIWRKLKLPLLRPFLYSGLTLIGLEVLGDFGAASIFNLNVFSTLIFKSWFSLQSIEGAALFAGLHLILVMFFFLIFRSKEKSLATLQSGTELKNLKTTSKLQSILCFSTCFLVWAISFAFPCLQLLTWAMKATSWSTLQNSINSMLYPLAYAIICSLITILVSFTYLRSYKSYWAQWVRSFSLLGYAIPGGVLAISLLLLWTFFFHNLQLKIIHISLFLGFGFIVKFLPLAVKPLKAAHSHISYSVIEMAKTLGLNKWQILYKLKYPILRKTILGSVLFIFIDISKEVPLSLGLRPTHYQSPSLLIYQYASESMWTQAALPSLMIISLTIFALIFFRRIL